MNFLDTGFRLLPVVVELDLAAHAALVAGKPLLMLLETVQGVDERLVALRGEAGDTDIDTDGCRRRGQRLLELALRLDRNEPLAT